MIIFSPRNKEIHQFDDWANIFLGAKKPKHWKEGRSAWSIADYITKQKGQQELEDIVSDIL
jgi:hypothetical protein